MAGYPFSHQADMIFMYGKANGNSRLASRLYYESFPDRQQPTHSTFAAVFNRLHETGTLLPSTADRGVQRQRRTPDLEENILQRVEEDPGRINLRCPRPSSRSVQLFEREFLATNYAHNSTIPRIHRLGNGLPAHIDLFSMSDTSFKREVTKYLSGHT
ncbi:hypothetical protein J6590_107452 [Homalodisca vitripennis]|nr:hypothetical protein J6590_107452 [Homalodisca vitripennis]